MSDKDLGAGTRWSSEIEGQLKECRFGIVCVTPDNHERPWLNFEAGALSNHLEQSRVTPYLLDIRPTEITGPLAQFHAKTSDRAGTLDIIKALNQSMSTEALLESRLEGYFNRAWPDMEAKISTIRSSVAAPNPEAPKRTIEDKVDEMLSLLRDRQAQALESSTSRYIADKRRRRLPPSLIDLINLNPDVLPYVISKFENQARIMTGERGLYVGQTEEQKGEYPNVVEDIEDVFVSATGYSPRIIFELVE